MPATPNLTPMARPAKGSELPLEGAAADCVPEADCALVAVAARSSWAMELENEAGAAFSA
jgi:hypothetical protein